MFHKWWNNNNIRSTITSTGSGSARGLHSTYEVPLQPHMHQFHQLVDGSCATLATDRGEGTLTCSGCTLSTAGAVSPLIYLTGTITAKGCTGTASGA